MGGSDYDHAAAGATGIGRGGRSITYTLGQEALLKLGTVFPQTEIGSDPAAIRDYAQEIEALGYSHTLVFDHVLGVDPEGPKPQISSPLVLGPKPEGGWPKRDWGGAYTNADAFHEPLTLFAFLAAVTTRLQFATGVLILPQRQTALVAKQAAEIALLSGDRLRLGVGVGWNPVEYQSLGMSFAGRGQREVEQVQLLRALWANGSVQFEGEWHSVIGAGINPRPASSIPVWIGGNSHVAMERAAMIGDGWLPSMRHEDFEAQLPKLNALLDQHGRDRATFGLESIVAYLPGQPERWERHLRAWAKLGVSHLSVDTMRKGLETPADHIRALRDYIKVARETLGDGLGE